MKAALSANYPLYQYRFVEFFIEHLCDLSRTFRGDLQEMIVLALVGQVQIRAMRSAAEAGLDPDDLPLDRLSITASSVADVTGIPRETVRRKLAALEQRGWILRNADGSFRLRFLDKTAVAKVDLSDIDARTLDRVARMFRDIESIVTSTPPSMRETGEPAQFGQMPTQQN